MVKKTTSITLAMTGASGAQYGLRLLQCLLAADRRVYLLLSRAAEVVIDTETDISLPQAPDSSKQLADQQTYLRNYFAAAEGKLQLLGRGRLVFPVASGSSGPTNMVICPASGGTLSAVAMGASNNLIERAADVVFKRAKKINFSTERSAVLIDPFGKYAKTEHYGGLLFYPQVRVFIKSLNL